ncbi:MAG: HAMP domain-containing protein [Nocardioides sp.]|nr:HAMP domain-containing protein [Nocardioides sp.]
MRRWTAWSSWTLRARLLVLALAGVAFVQAVGSVALYVGLSVSGTRSLDASARATSAEVAGLVRAGRLPTTLPVTGGEIVQVLDAQGRVLSGSTNADRLTAILLPAEMARATAAPVTISGARLGVTSELRTSVQPVSDAAGATVSVVVAQPVEELGRNRDFLGTLLLLSYPLLLAVLGLISWRMIGAALRPVERLRSTAERISGSPADERLPLPAATDEVHALATTLNSMLDRVAAARERERDLVADVAHELRSPLASMRLQIDVARRLGEGGEVVEDLDSEVARMSALVDDLLVLARLDHGQPVPSGPLDVAPVLEAAAQAWSGASPAVTLEPPGRLAARGQADELARIVANLVTNASRHARSRVRLSGRVEHGRVLVRVDDDGPGVAETERERVFDRFVRLDEARDRDSGGSGLGLAIARELARGRDGDVRLSTSDLGGLRAEVDLPAVAPGPATLPD